MQARGTTFRHSSLCMHATLLISERLPLRLAPHHLDLLHLEPQGEMSLVSRTKCSQPEEEPEPGRRQQI